MIYFIKNTSKKYDHLDEAIYWALNELKIVDSKHVINVNVTKKALTEYKAHGFLTEIISSKGKLKLFEVLINPDQNKSELIKTLFHELVHVKQITKGELKFETERSSFWKGKLVHPNRFKIYKNIPWEKEAYDMEEKLYRKYLSIRKDIRRTGGLMSASC